MSEFYLSEKSEKDRPWDKHRAKSSQVSELYRGSFCDDYSQRIYQCSTLLEFAEVGDGEGDKLLKLQRARFCRVRHCPTCQWRRSLMWKARLLKSLPQIMEDYPTARWVFLTLTVRNCRVNELRATIKSMNDGWKRLSNRKFFPAIGFIKAIEVTRGEDGSAHPHIHVLMMVPASYYTGAGYIKQDRWREMWRDACRLQYEPWVHVQSIKAKSGKEPIAAIIDAVSETVKYTVKEDDLVADRDWLLEMTSQLHKTRSVAVGGVLKSYLSESEPETDEELIHGDDEPGEVKDEDPRLLFGWWERERRYKGRYKQPEDSE